MNPKPSRSPLAEAHAPASAPAAAVALALVCALLLPACGPAAQSRTPTPAPSERYEQAIDLPADIVLVNDLAYAADGTLLMAATGSDSPPRTTVFAESVEGFWEPLFDTRALTDTLGESAVAGMSCLTPDGRLLCAVSGSEDAAESFYLVDPASYSEVPLAAGTVMKMRCFDDETVFVYDWTKTFARYDLSTGKRLCEYRVPSTAVLDDFTVYDGRVFATASQSEGSSSSYSCLVFDVESGEKEAVDPSLQSTLNGLFSASDAPDAKAPVWASNSTGLYLCAKSKLYACSGESATVLASGESMNLSNTAKSPHRLLVGETSDDIAVLYLAPSGSDQHTLYRYIEGERPEPTASITVYTLEDNANIQQAVATYRDKHPETALEVRVGISANSGMSADDALRSLNADILAGNGPDVIVLDGLPIDDFAEQGVLLDLSDTVRASLDNGDEYFENAVNAFSTDEGCYAVPSRFGVPAVFGDAAMVARATSFEELADFVTSSDETKAAFSSAVSVPALYAASYRALFGDGSGVDRDALEAFFAGTKALMSIGNERLSENAPAGYDYLASQLSDITRSPYGLSGTGMLGMGADPARLEIGMLLSSNNFGMTSLAAENASFECAFEPLDFGFGRAFVPSSILAVNAASTKTDAAKDFVSYLLSKEHQKQSGLDIGLPVSKTAYTEQTLELGGYSVGFMGDAGNDETSFSRGAFTEAEVAEQCALIDSADVCCAPDKTISDIVEAELLAYCRDASTLDQAVDAVMQKLDLYLAQ